MLTLNKNQKEAINHKQGPILVIAGAGTGKTRVITERIRKLIQEDGVKPKEILALTFTEKAANEMQERIGDVMPLGYEEPWVSTFHTFADRLLRENGLEIGLDTTYRLIADPDQWLLLRKNLFKLQIEYFRPLGNPTKFLSDILKFISRLQDENISTQDFTDFANKRATDLPEESVRWHELAYLYKKYQELKMEKSKMDFGDLITWSLKLLTMRPTVLKKYQTQFKHIFVDEFQDTNYAQYELIKLLFPNTENSETTQRTLMAVGDDSQSIYKFRGAAVSNIIQFMDDYKDAKMLTLVKNYRSTQEVLDPAYKMIQNNNPDTLESKLGISKKLESQISKPKANYPKPQILRADTLENEVETVIQKILEILAKEPQYNYKDIAILARANNHLEPFIMALRKYGLPYQLVGNRGLYERDEIRDILALIKVMINPYDSINLYRVLTIATLKIPYETVTKLLTSSRTRKQELWEMLLESKDPAVQEFHKKLSGFQKDLSKETPVNIVYKAITQFEYVTQFTEEETVEGELALKNLNKFMDRVKKFEIDFREETKGIPTIVDFIDFIELMLDAGENPAQAEFEDIETINLMTVHASKGLEFPVVFMVNLVGDRFPSRGKKDVIEIPDELVKEHLPSGDEHIQEERRLFYVGMTRAKKYLYLTLGKNYGGKRDKVPSGFLGEIGLELTEVENPSAEDAPKSLFGVDTNFRDAPAIRADGWAPESLSYSKMESYQKCPLKYKYAYILCVPTAPNHSLSFGNSIHYTLRDFHTKLATGNLMTPEELLKTYEKNWEPLGYMNEEHRNIRFDSGKKLLLDYYEKNKDIKVKHLDLEKWFSFYVDGVKFNGRIDRIDKLPDGSVEIIDYKTGSAKDQKEVDKDGQVAVYSIAAKETLGYEPKMLSYYFVEKGEKVSTSRTPEQLIEMKEQIREVIKSIKLGNFEARPGMQCDWCDYKEICPFAFKN